MCYGADRLARCDSEAKKGEVRKKQAPQCFTDFKACFSTQLTDGLRWTLDHCCIDDGLRRLLIMCYGADRLARCEAKKGEVRKKQAPQCFTDFKAFSTQLTDGLR